MAARRPAGHVGQPAGDKHRPGAGGERRGGELPDSPKGIVAWAKQHKGPAAAIGAVGAVGIYLMYKHGQAANAATGTSGSGSGSGGYTGRPGTLGGYTGYPATSGNTDGTLAAQMAKIEQLLSELVSRQDQKHPSHQPPRPHP